MSYSIIIPSTPASFYQDDEKKPFIFHSSSSSSSSSSETVKQRYDPQTSASSAFSFLVNEHEGSIEQANHTQLDTNSNRLSNVTHPHYGSVFSTSPDSVNQKKVAMRLNLLDFNYASTVSTISPNDDDEGLYLLWTHQLLRERGYQPSSCKVDADIDDRDNECCSIDSSITDLSTITQTSLSDFLLQSVRWISAVTKKIIGRLNKLIKI